ncbi:ribonuclease Y [Helicobacter ailurogastricus]|uniref:ribonuclease Y n=1 Tax=Helicobacter ailurogastricus TaxID=1578720 RepID=UPI0022BCA2F8|nr:ribonuclease Y [Helicobacter ailurogastricus]GLH58723.1 Ribonuclease Y Rny [Helicobacter ailurogastricus]GLH60251.1 Ribonuclease Y Rny [Helicobacter ailurogastricus]
MEEALSILIPCLLTGIGVFYFTKRSCHASSQTLIAQAKAKADMLIYQAQVLYKTKEEESKTLALQLQQDHQERQKTQDAAYQYKLDELKSHEKQQQQHWHHKHRQLEQSKAELESLKQELEHSKRAQDKLCQEYQELKDQALQTLMERSGYTKEEAQTLLLRLLEEELILQKAALVRRYEKQAKKEAKERAHFILAEATSRFASSFAMENLTSVVALPNAEFIGRIIGKEGKNIDTFKRISGVELMIDEETKTITLSCFNLYRRQIATQTLELLIQDGRIQPSRIETVYQRVEANMEENILKEAEEVILDLQLDSMDEELKRLLGRMKYRTSYGQNALTHSIEVAILAGMIAEQLGGDAKLARRAGILHDIGKALTQEHGGDHVELGAEVCVRYHEHPVVINAIYAHHDRQEIKSIECAAVCAADALSAARPGARRKENENFLARMHDLERIASQQSGVEKVFAMDAGREVRVIVCPDQVSDAKVPLLARDIAKEIQTHLQYPGEVVVHVIRENHAKAVAH